MAKSRLRPARSPFSTKIVFNTVDVVYALSAKHRLRNWIAGCINYELGQHIGFISINLCGDKFLHKMNVEYLHHDTYTDIITFDMSENGHCSGDIYISLERVRENSSIHSVSFKNELQRVIIHGILHLCGYKDTTLRDKALMRKKEEYYLSLLS
jgi:probable rRNA maturation factor